MYLETILDGSRGTGNTTALVSVLHLDKDAILLVGKHDEAMAIGRQNPEVQNRIFSIQSFDVLKGMTGKRVFFDHTAVAFIAAIEYKRGKESDMLKTKEEIRQEVITKLTQILGL